MAATQNKKLHIKKGDTVLVLVGKSEKEGGDRGKRAKVIATSPKTNQVIVDGVNIQKKHQKARSAQDTGGIIDKTGPINASNVQVVCPSCKKPTRVGITETKGGKEKRIRTCKKCGESLDKSASAKTEKKAKDDKPKKEKTKKEEK